MENKYRRLFFKYFYDSLQLNKVEELFKKQGIKKIINDKLNNCFGISDYFYLLNEVNLNNLTEDEYKYLDNIDINNCDLNDLISYLIATYKKVLFPKTSDDYVYYGPMTYDYMAPSDAIVIGVRYDKYGFDSGDRLTLEQVDSNEEVLCDILNGVQEENYDKIKVAFIRYHEFYGKVPELYEVGNKTNKMWWIV